MISFFELLLICFAVGLLLSHRTRKFGLGLIGFAVAIAGVGLFLGLFSVRSFVRHEVVPGEEITVAEVPYYAPEFASPQAVDRVQHIAQGGRYAADGMQPIADGVEYVGNQPWEMQQRAVQQAEQAARRAEVQHDQAQRRAESQQTEAQRQVALHLDEITRNQRLQSRVDGAVQIHMNTGDNSELETYADGMQIKQHANGSRQIIRESDQFMQLRQPAPFAVSSPAYSGASNRTTWFGGFILLPFLVLIAVFLLTKKGASHATGAWLRWLWVPALLAAPLLFFGYAARSWESHRVPSPPAPLAHSVYPPLSDSPSQQAFASSAADSRGLAEAYEEVIESYNGAPERESIEAMFNKLTMPKIKLDGLPVSVGKVPEMNSDLAGAMRQIVGAAAPAAEPITEGWLITAGKALGELAKEQVRQAEAMARLAHNHVAQAEKIVAKAHAMETKLQSTTTRNDSGMTIVKQIGIAGSGSGGYKPTLKPVPPVFPAPAAKAVAAANAGASVTPDPFVLQPSRIPLTPMMPFQITGKAHPGWVRPDWVDQPTKLVGKVQRIALSAGPYTTVKECQADLMNQMRAAVLQRAIDRAHEADPKSPGVPSLESMGIDTTYILRELCTGEFSETVDTSVGEMKKAYALLEFNEAQDAILLDRAQVIARRHGLVRTVVAAGSVLSVLSLALALLKLDTWTRGYYSKRLFIGVPAAIIAVAGLLSLLG